MEFFFLSERENSVTSKIVEWLKYETLYKKK